MDIGRELIIFVITIREKMGCHFYPPNPCSIFVLLHQYVKNNSWVMDIISRK